MSRRTSRSKSNRIILLGKTGQLGWELQRALAPLGTVVAWGRAEVDLVHPEQLRGRIRAISPSLIVNAAAYTAVDRAEQEPEVADLVNREAPRVMSEEAAVLGVPLVHYSTDYVFDGEKAVPYVETDAAAPQSVYGRSKRAGEVAILDSGVKGLIFRTSWVFGEIGRNFVRTILRLGFDRESLQVVADQVGAPTPAALLADVTAHAIHQLDREGWPPARIYHLAASHNVTWCAFARAIVTKAAEKGMPLKLCAEAIRPIRTEEYPLIARRPRNSRLDCTAFEREFQLTLPDWEPYLERLLERIAGSRAGEV